MSYNYLDLPTRISNSVGQIEFVYDASGNLLTKTVTYNAGLSPVPTTTDYVKGIEYVNDVMTSIYHDEGRLVQVNGTWQSEYVIKDHLGNARVTFRDIDGNGFITASDITQEANYYPFGMQMEGAGSPAAAVRIPYLYNGIEHVSDLGLDINTALFRTLDPALGRWWQIDPKAEALKSLSPYNAMNNNPILASDPNGDLAFTGIEAAFQIGAAIAGPVLNALSGKYKGNALQFFGDLGLNLVNAVVNAAISEVNPLDFNAGFASGGISVRTQIGTDGIGIGIEAGVSAGYGNHRFVEAYAGVNLYSSAMGTNRPTVEGYIGVGVGYKYLMGSGDVLCP